VDKDTQFAWQLIHDRLKSLGKLQNLTVGSSMKRDSAGRSALV
jgi:hypothetical protein